LADVALADMIFHKLLDTRPPKVPANQLNGLVNTKMSSIHMYMRTKKNVFFDITYVRHCQHAVTSLAFPPQTISTLG
jgi:hypothetical protein